MASRTHMTSVPCLFNCLVTLQFCMAIVFRTHKNHPLTTFHKFTICDISCCSRLHSRMLRQGACQIA